MIRALLVLAAACTASPPDGPAPVGGVLLDTATDPTTLPVVAAVTVSPARLVAGQHVGGDAEPLTIDVRVPVTLGGSGLPLYLEAAQEDRSLLQVELPVIAVEIADEDARTATTFAPPRFCRRGDPCTVRDGLWRAWHVAGGRIVRELQPALGWADLSRTTRPVANVVGVWMRRDEPVPAGDTVRLVYQGPVPERATWTGTPLRPRVRWRPVADPACPAADRSCWTEADPGVVEGWHVEPAPPAFLSVKAPLDAGLGETDDVRLVVTDAFGNPSPWTGRATLTEAVDAEVRFDGAWSATVPVTWDALGPTRVLPTVDDPAVRPVHHWTVVSARPAYRRRIGDVHIHTGDGGAQRAFLGHFRAGDHAGLFTATDASLRYLHEVAGHDFGAVSEHAMRTDAWVAPPGVLDDPAFVEGGACAGEQEIVSGIRGWWTTSQRVARTFDRPGFTVFPAFEWQSHHDNVLEATLNHRVVLYRDFHADDAHPLLPGDTPGLSPRCLPRFLQSAGYGPDEALILPHLQVASNRNLDWDLTWRPWADAPVDLAVVEAYTPIAEIFSARSYRDRGQGRIPDAAAFEGDALDPAPFTFRYGWRDTSAHVGVVGSSDGHTAAPGVDDPFAADGTRSASSEPGGAAVAIVREDGRDGLWDAFRSRRTYATTGHRGWLDLTLGGAPMGSAIAADTASLELTLAVHVGLELARVEVWAARVGDPEWPWTAPYAAYPDGESHTAAFDLPNPVDRGAVPGEWVYYLRALARWDDEPLDEAEAMWSSPIWVRWSASG